MIELADLDLDLLENNLTELSEDELRQLLESLEELDQREYANRCRNDLIAFCCHMESHMVEGASYKAGNHLKMLADLLQQVEKGEKDRIAVSMPPRHGKSHLVSTYYPAWFIGRNPSKQVMLVSHTIDLAVDFGRKVREVVNHPAYRMIFPDVELATDSKSAGRWNTNKRGIFYATGVGSALAGRGADLLIVDDPFSEQDVLHGNYEVFEKVYNWFAYGARTRLMPGGRIAVVHTRWSTADLIGRLAKDMANSPESDQYEFFEFPAILNEGTDREKALWPEFFDLAALRRTKASMPLFQWNAQYQQNPTAEEGAVIRREWWKKWEKDEAPPCEYIIMAIDAAAEMKERNDFTAITTWGVFRDDFITGGASHIILLNAINARMEYPELKATVAEQYKLWQPDAFIIEKKSNGVPLVQEFRRMGVPLQEFTPHRGTGDKLVRLKAVSDIVQSGMVWYPSGKKWAEEVVEQVAAFPAGEHDDLVDTMSMALARFRSGGFIRLPTDEPDEPLYPMKMRYYW